MDLRSRRRATCGRAAAIVMSFLVASCVSQPDGGETIAESIRSRGDPSVAVVRYESADDLDAASLWIMMRPGATKQQAMAFACDVVQPAIAEGQPPPEFAFFIWDASEEVLLAHSDTPCANG